MASQNRTGGRRTKGQSLPLIALMIVVLVGMVGLSVDVGNTFNQERQTVSATNAASLAAMNKVLRKNASDTNQVVYGSIIATLKANGVEVAADGVATGTQRRMEAYYIDAQGKPIGAIVSNGSTIPANVAYIQVKVSGLVDTYFAKVVGRPDLPISASGYAGQCGMGDGVYPLAIEKTTLDGNNFAKTPDVDPADTQADEGWRIIQSGTYRGYTARHIYVHDGTSLPGAFGFLRWMADTGQTGRSATSAQELETSLANQGNLAWGFQEAPEPIQGNQVADPLYPYQAGQLNAGDWIYGTPGWKAGAQAPLDLLIASGTKMVLPIYDQAVGQGSSDANGVRYHVAEFGTFVLLSQGAENGKKYFEFVYLGASSSLSTACSTSPVPPSASSCCDLWGGVSVLPEYKIIPTDRVPIQYVIVLDQSGSMAWNFAGGGANAANPSRISLAKQALKTLVRLTNMPDNVAPNYVPNTPSDQMALVGFSTIVYPKTFANNASFSSSATELNTMIDGLGTYNTTNGAAGLYYASTILNSAPETVTYPASGGKSYTYRRVVVFITDGVSNVFFHKDDPDLAVRSSDGVTYANGNYCRTNSNVTNDADCQTTTVGGLYTTTVRINNVNTSVGLDRPITQAIKTSQDLLKANGHTVFVVALSDVPSTGLKGGVATRPEYFVEAKTVTTNPDGSTSLDADFQKINSIVEDLACQNGQDTDTTGTVLASQYVPVVLPNSMTLDYPKVGMVTLENSSTGYSATAYITAATDGKITYRFSQVPPGVYSLTAVLYYKHPLEPSGINDRAYTSFWDPTSSSRINALTVTVNESTSSVSGFTLATQVDIDMRLTGVPCGVVSTP